MTTHCPPAEQLAEFAEGNLKSADTLLLHVEGCRDCRAALTLLNETIAAERKPARLYWWGGLAVAAMLAIALFLWDPTGSRSPRMMLANLTPDSGRIVEPRLSGFGWKPYAGPMRGTGGSAEAQQLKLAGAAGRVIERAARDSSPEAQHAAGVAYVLIEQWPKSTERLRDAANRSPESAGVWNDLAAAQYTAALRIPDPALLPEALASADHALRIQPNHAEALFNRALILEHLGDAAPARTAWKRYLAADPSSRWAVEARARLAELR
jgi:tetratricopeptide (TPR) repeat protein